jgi:UDP-3-O-[3-hydroxymyristoyl] glucosamine N-acyltransferase
MTKPKYFKHKRAIIERKKIAAGARIWSNAHVMSGVSIGKRRNIREGCFIESGVTIGNDVVIKEQCCSLERCCDRLKLVRITEEYLLNGSSEY